MQGTEYSLFGVVSYELTDEDLSRIEAVIKDISYFRNAERDELFINISILLVDSTYERIIEIAGKTDEILNSHKIIDLDEWPSAATDIEYAKERWNSAVSDFVRDEKRVASFIFFKEVVGVPLQVFAGVHESLYEELNKIATETIINVTLTSDDQSFTTRYGCYVTSPKA